MLIGYTKRFKEKGKLQRNNLNLHFFKPQCKKTRSRPGDGIDNDCDGKIDEELLDGLDTDGDGLIGEDLAVVIKFRWGEILRFCGHAFFHIKF